MAKSLQTEFVKYYKEKLEPLGFKKVKGRQPYFVRVVNDEILHIFTFKGVRSTEFGYKAFHLMCGVATVYKKEINFSIPPSQNSDWLVVYGDFYEIAETDYPVVKFPRDSMIFYYNDENLNEILDETYKGAKFIINKLDKVLNMDDILNYLLKYDAKNITFRCGLDDSCFDEEGMYYARKEFDDKKIDRIFEDKQFDFKNCSWSDEEKNRLYSGMLEWQERLKEDRTRFLSNEEDYEKGMKLLKEHYETNVDKLIGYGLDIKKRKLEF